MEHGFVFEEVQPMGAGTDEPMVYLCFYLFTKDLNATCERKLRDLGVECVSEGACYEAFGIAPDSDDLLAEIEEIDEILSVERKEPVSTK